jgi:hypothetical protein
VPAALALRLWQVCCIAICQSSPPRAVQCCCFCC